MRRRAELLEWIRALPEEEVDAEVERALGLPPRSPAPPLGEHLIGYFPSSVPAIVEAIDLVPIRASNVVIDLGAGLGKVCFLVHLATGARCVGVELQPDLVAAARAASERLGVRDDDVSFVEGDVREVDEALLREGDVFYMFTPFRGPALDAVLCRLERIAATKRITVAALGFDIERPSGGVHRPTGWLARRPTRSWLAIYDAR